VASENHISVRSRPSVARHCAELPPVDFQEKANDPDAAQLVCLRNGQHSLGVRERIRWSSLRLESELG